MRRFVLATSQRLPLNRVHPAALGAVFCVVCCSLLLTTGCSKKKHAPRAPQAPAPGWTETGVASWYGDPYHGRRAANGEIYDMEQLTAAHRTLPFGALVRVTNLSNDRQVEVRINDRGPFKDGRIIDLSRAAARDIELLRPGTARVRVQLLGYTAARPAGGVYAVQVGAFSNRKSAENLGKRLRRNYDPVDVIARGGDQAAWRVIVGSKSTQADAEALASALRHDHKDVFVVRLD